MGCSKILELLDVNKKGKDRWIRGFCLGYFFTKKNFWTVIDSVGINWHSANTLRWPHGSWWGHKRVQNCLESVRKA